MARKHDIRRGDGFVQERVIKSGEVRYQARWHDGLSWRSKTFGNVEDAEDHLRTIGRSKRTGTYSPDSDLNVSQVVDEYLERGKSRWSAVTYAGYRQITRAHIDKRIGHVRISDLTSSQVQRWIGSLEAANLHSKTIHNCRIVLNGACREAVVLGIIRENPVAPTRAPKRKRKHIDTWTREHIDAVLAHASSSTMMHAFYAVALTTAMRPGEIRALRWSDVDFDAGVIHCRRTMTRDENFSPVVGDTTKTNRARQIAVPSQTMRLLQRNKVDQNQRRLAATCWNSTNLVFDRGDGNVIPQQKLGKLHLAICTLAEVPEIRVHDLRHTAATIMLRNGVNLKIVSEILGHSSISTTADIYSHVDLNMQRTATDALGDLLTDREELRA